MSRVRQYSTAGLQVAVLSDVGMRRPMNQDAYRVAIQQPGDQDASGAGHLLVVADGMGAHAAGELASKLAVDAVVDVFGSRDASQQLGSSLVAAVRAANQLIHRRGQEDTQLYNMGTTCSAVVFGPEGALVGHVGDSRVYRCRDARMDQLTFDHSLVWEMRVAGQCSGSASNVPRNVITRCLGPHAEVDIDLEGAFSVQANDRFLLCSDGLSGRVEDAELGAVVEGLPPEQAVQFLVDLANLRGGSDNITAMLAQVQGPELQAVGTVPDRGATTTPGTHPGWWLAVGGGLIGAVFSGHIAGVTELSAGAVTACCVAVAAMGIAGAMGQWWAQRQRGNDSAPLPSPPYATASAALNEELAESLVGTLVGVLECLPDESPVVVGRSELIRQWQSNLKTAAPSLTELAEVAREMMDEIRPQEA